MTALQGTASSLVCAIICKFQAEAKGDNNTFRGHLLNLLQEEYARREETRENDHNRWIGFVSLICSVFHNIKVRRLFVVSRVINYDGKKKKFAVQHRKPCLLSF